MNKVALIIIYNHQYLKNIEVVEEIYKNRFSNIYHLVPFYQGAKSNVIAVYDCSFYFEGYVAQGLKMYFDKKYTHYFFIADDLLLNPIINETNYDYYLKLKTNSCYISRLSTLNENKAYWHWNLKAFRYNLKRDGVEATNYLPDYNTASGLLKKFGLEIKPLSFQQIWESPNSNRQFLKVLLGEKVYNFFRQKELHRKSYSLTYPLIRSYSDIFVISSNAIKKFCHYCGVFAATELFVELAIPTSLVFSAEDIVVEKDLELKGRALWTAEDHLILEKYNNQLIDLMENFPNSYLFIHPIKLSKWEIELEKINSNNFNF
jgi:hypothetical protein